LDLTEFETTTGGTWRLAGCRDHWSKYELGRHVSPTANQHDAIIAIGLALTEAQRLAGKPLVELAARDDDGNVVPLVTIVTDNGGPFRSFRFEAFIATHPELRQSAPESAHPDRTAHANAASGR
jgi:transposase InsO family protein